MFKNLLIINKSTGEVVASVVLNPLVKSTFGIELDKDLNRVFVVRSIPGDVVSESIPIGDLNTRIKIQ